MRRSMLTMKAARVLPEPVGAEMSVSRPAMISGQPPDWASVGAAKRRSNHARTAGWNWSRMPIRCRLLPGPDSGVSGVSANVCAASLRPGRGAVNRRRRRHCPADAAWRPGGTVQEAPQDGNALDGALFEQDVSRIADDDVLGLGEAGAET